MEHVYMRRVASVLCLGSRASDHPCHIGEPTWAEMRCLDVSGRDVKLRTRRPPFRPHVTRGERTMQHALVTARATVCETCVEMR